MRIHLACDHAAYETMLSVADYVRSLGHEVVDHGPKAYNATDDYPEFCLKAAQAVADEPGSLGIVSGGSGNGEQMAANKVGGIRAALAWNPEIARLSREHNDANVLSFGARMHSETEIFAIIDAFIAEPFSGVGRHTRRIGQVRHFEKTGTILDSETEVDAEGAFLG